MRFRTSGRNWEPRPWQLAPSLIVLGQQISVVHPAGRPGDGTVASKAHDEASPTSDHRPTPYTGPGIVRAIDVGEAKNNDPMVASLVASRDPRIAYIIYEGRAIRSYPRPGEPAWTWHPYRGPAPHSHHWHLSILRTSTADNDTRPWAIMEDDMPLNEQDAALIRQIVREESGPSVMGQWLRDPEGFPPGVEGNPLNGNALHYNTIFRKIRGDTALIPALESGEVSEADLDERVAFIVELINAQPAAFIAKLKQAL